MHIEVLIHGKFLCNLQSKFTSKLNTKGALDTWSAIPFSDKREVQAQQKLSVI